MRFDPLSSLRWMAVGAALVLAGCQSWNEQLHRTLPLEDVGKRRQERAEQIARDFEAQRDRAEFEAASTRWQSGDSAGCRDGLEKILQRNPAHLDSRLMLAEIAVAEGQHDEAMRHLNVALERFPTDGRVHYTAAMLLDGMDQTSEAMEHFQRAADLEPNNPLYAEMRRRVGEEQNVSSQPGEVPPLSHVGQTPPASQQACPLNDTPSDTTWFSDAAVEPSQNAVQQTAFREAVPEPATPAPHALPVRPWGAPEATHPLAAESVAPLLDAAESAFRAGDRETALACCLQAVNQRPDDPQVVVSTSVLALKHNYPDVAAELLAPATERFPQSAAVFRTLGAARYRQGDYRDAQKALVQAMALDKSTALTYFLMGCTLTKLGDASSAAPYFRQAALLDPRYSAR